MPPAAVANTRPTHATPEPHQRSAEEEQDDCSSSSCAFIIRYTVIILDALVFQGLRFRLWLSVWEGPGSAQQQQQQQ